MARQTSSSRRIAAEYLREQLEMDGLKTSALSSIFAEEPPDLKTFLYDKKYLNHLRATIPFPDENGYKFTLSDIQYDFVRNFEQIFSPELYIAMVEEFGPQWSPLPMKNMFAVCHGKGCPVAGEKVYSTEDGQWRNIEEVADDIAVAALDTESKEFSAEQGTSSWVSGTGECFEVVTASGAKTRVYGGHRFFTRDGWKKLWDIHEGELIANALSLQVTAPVGADDDETIVRYAESSETMQSVPREVFSLPDGQVALFLSHLFGGDVYDPTTSRRYSSNSEEMARDVYRLLKRLGITSTITRGGDQGHLQFEVVIDRSVGRTEGDIFWDPVIAITPIGEHEYYDLSVPGLENYVSTDGLVAHNSGKDSTVRIGFVRIASLLGHMVSPQSYFKMAQSDSIHMLNVAVNAQQARDAFFDPMKKLFLANKHLSELFHGDDPAEGASRLKLKHNITIISGHSLAENQEGLNLLAGVADEISAFKTAEEFQSSRDGRASRGADAIVDMLRSSASSRFPETHKVVQISWPRFHNDAIMKAISTGNQSLAEFGEESPWYVSGPYATWEVNPKVTKESMAHHFKENYEKAMAMYAAKPPKSSNTFIRNETAVDAAFAEIRENPVKVEYYWGQPPEHALEEGPRGMLPQDGWQVEFTFSDDLEPVDGAQYCLHGDMAISGDRAGIAMSHVRTYREGSADGDELPVVKNDFTFSFESDLNHPEHPREIQIRWYRQLIWELVERGFDIAVATFDQFQSTSLRQNLEDYGIESGLLSLDRNDKVYQEFKDCVLDYRLEGYRISEELEPRYMKEVKHLRKKGKKVDHPPSSSKDEADALAGSVFNAILTGGSEDEDYIEDSQEYDLQEYHLWNSGPSVSGNQFNLFGAPSSNDTMFSGTHDLFG